MAIFRFPTDKYVNNTDLIPPWTVVSSQVAGKLFNIRPNTLAVRRHRGLKPDAITFQGFEQFFYRLADLTAWVEGRDPNEVMTTWLTRNVTDPDHLAEALAWVEAPAAPIPEGLRLIERALGLHRLAPRLFSERNKS